MLSPCMVLVIKAACLVELRQQQAQPSLLGCVVPLYR